MKKQKSLLLTLIALLLIFTVTGCTNKTNDEENTDITDLYTLTQNDDSTYSYTFVDLYGNILFEKHNVVREPKINMISADVYELITQTGTGLSTNWSVYCDVENSKVSETFYYVLGSQSDYVIYGDYEDGKHLIIVQNIFDKSEYCKTYELENVSPVVADFAIGCEFDNDSNATITYLTGEDYTETEITIKVP